jgi:hypothetical protein
VGRVQLKLLEENKMVEAFSLKDLKFEFDLSKTDYQLDILQNELLKSYIRADPRFRRAFNQNYTSQFFQFLRDKTRLHEPVHLSVIGQVRSGKSYSAISICAFHQACFGRRFTSDFIVGNAVEFLERLRTLPEDLLKDSIFLIDEEKQGIFNLGSIAKKTKLQDVQNIVAIKNISTVMLNPISWADKNASYGLRCFGRCFKTKTCRFMLYNLQAGGKSSELPMSNVYIPIFTTFLPKDYSDKLEKLYLKKKNEWVVGEMRGEGDVLAELRKKSAENFVMDKTFVQIKKKKEQLAYIMNKLGSEWTSKECEDILTLTSLLQQGFLKKSG